MNRTIKKFMLHVAFGTLAHNRVLPDYVSGGHMKNPSHQAALRRSGHHLAMLATHVTLAVLAVRALSALASPGFTVQDSDHHVASDDIRFDTESAKLLTSDPEVLLDNGLFVGAREAQTDRFLGIPFALPPTGNRRLRPPVPTDPYVGTHKVQEFGYSCPQQALPLPNGLNSRLVRDIGSVLDNLYENLTPSDEDCLTINVWKPSTATPSSQLPVLVWIFGGGFQIGGSSGYDGASVVNRSIDLKQPVVLVSMNYRLSALGFLPGKEVKDAKVGNLGLQDQRLALKWIQTYITRFGGDPKKVTIWGESSGAMSVSLHMLLNNGNQEGLFRGAVMQSGSPIPVGDIEQGQQYYDFMVNETGCSDELDTLDCLRKVSYATYQRAMDASPRVLSYQGLVLAWMPRVDGHFVTEPPQYSVLRGHVANVPVITGNCDDEGSLFSISTINISTTDELKEDYLKRFMMPRATEPEIDRLLVHYPDDLAAGCPFDTGSENALGPQFKRVGAIQGDFVFHGPRRFFLNHRADKQNSWGFIWKRLKSTPFLGSAHGTDRISSWGPNGELKDYIIRFTNKLDPNGEGLGIPWPQWYPTSPKALVLRDDADSPLIIADDTYRSLDLDYIADLSLRYPL